MHGIGNDFVMVDAVSNSTEGADWPEMARRMCNRKFGVGSDGLILVLKDSDGSFRMRMLNPDGSESEMCGNGIRCFLKFLHLSGHTTELKVAVETGAGLLHLESVENGDVRVDMGLARFKRSEIGIVGDPESTFQMQPVDFAGHVTPGTAVSMGNPHVVFFVPDIAAVPLENWGPIIEHHALFPSRVNVHFAQVVNQSNLKMRTWERGAGITLACGTGACAVAVAGYVNGLSASTVHIDLPGGRLKIDIDKDWRVWMTGPAEVSFEGTWDTTSLVAV